MGSNTLIDDKRLFKRVEQISRSTTEAISQAQKSFVPTLVSTDKNKILEEYTYNGMIYQTSGVAIIFSNCICKNLHNTVTMKETFLNLFNNNKIYPILIFINDKLIRWSRINIVIDYHYTYFLIDGIKKEDIESLRMYALPIGVDYYEDDDIEFKENQMRFNEDGVLDINSNKVIIEYSMKNLIIKFYEGLEIEPNISRSKITPINFILFKNGVLMDRPEYQIIREYDNKFSIIVEDTEATYQSFIFYYNMEYENVEHLDKVSNVELARELFLESDDKAFEKNIMKTLDIDYEKIYSPKEYEKIVRDIVDYDKSLLNKIFDNDMQSIVYTGAFLKSISRNGYMTLRSPDYHYECGMIMFVNGELYKNYRLITYNSGVFKIPTNDIKASDTVEVLFFNKVINHEYKVKIPPEGLQISSLIDQKRMRVLAPYVLLENHISWNYNCNDIIYDIYFLYDELIYQTKNENNTLFGKIIDKGASFEPAHKLTIPDAEANCELINDRYGNIYALINNKYIYKYNRKGLLLWRFEYDQEITAIRVKDNVIYIGLNEKLNKLTEVEGTIYDSKSFELTSCDRISYINFFNNGEIVLLDEDCRFPVMYKDVLYYLREGNLYKKDNTGNEELLVSGEYSTFTVDDNYYYLVEWENNENIIRYNRYDSSTEEIRIGNGIIKIVRGERNNIYVLTCLNEIIKLDAVRIENNHVWYKIPYTIDEDRILKVDDRYQNTDITIFSNKCFKYFGTIVNEEDIAGVILPEEFSLCKDWDQFMIFLNGRRLDQTSYAITTMKIKDPFTHTSVFLSIPIEMDDRIDVFYLPTQLKDVSKFLNIDDTGYIEIDHDLFPYGFSNDTAMVFINGRKTNSKISKDIHSYKIKIDEDIPSVHNVNVVQCINDNTYSSLLQGATSDWDLILESLYFKKLNDLMGCKEINIGREASFKEYQATIKTPIYEIFYHYYLSDRTRVSEILLYDFMSADFDFDSAGTMVPSVFDATLIDKFKPKNYKYPLD